jgi:hypothetical protein
VATAAKTSSWAMRIVRKNAGESQLWFARSFEERPVMEKTCSRHLSGNPQPRQLN